MLSGSVVCLMLITAFTSELISHVDMRNVSSNIKSKSDFSIFQN